MNRGRVGPISGVGGGGAAGTVWNIVVHGNSIVDGTNSTDHDTLSWAPLMAAQLAADLPSHNITVTRRGTGGIQTHSLTAEFNTVVEVLKVPGARNVVVMFEIGNSLLAGRSEAQVKTDVIAYKTAAVALGWEVGICTAPPRRVLGGWTAGMQTALQNINADIIANTSTYGTFLVNTGPACANNDGTWLASSLPDGTHPDDPGHALIADMAAGDVGFYIEPNLLPVGYTPSVEGGLVLDFDIIDPTAFVQSGGVITQWTNRVSSVVTAEATNRPAYNATGIAGQPAAVFDGVNDLFVSTEAAVAAMVDGTKPLYVAMTAYYNVADALGVVLSWGKASGTAGGNIGQNNTNAGCYQFVTTNNAAGTVTSISEKGDVATTDLLQETFWVADVTKIKVLGGANDPIAGAHTIGATTCDRFAIGVRQRTTLAQFFAGRTNKALGFSTGSLCVTDDAAGRAARRRVRRYLRTYTGITTIRN